MTSRDEPIDDLIRRRIERQLPMHDTSDWKQVFAAAHTKQRRLSRGRGAVVVVLIAAIVAAPAYAFGGRMIDLFQTKNVVVQPARFRELPAGWHAFYTDPYLLHPNGTSAWSYATSWNYRPNPVAYAGSMPHGGAFIQVGLLRQQIGRSHVNLCMTAPRNVLYPVRNTPLRLPLVTRQTLEGEPGVKEYRLFGRHDDQYNFEVRADVRATTPSPQLLATLQRIVAKLELSDWPQERRC